MPQLNEFVSKWRIDYAGYAMFCDYYVASDYDNKHQLDLNIFTNPKHTEPEHIARHTLEFDFETETDLAEKIAYLYHFFASRLPVIDQTFINLRASIKTLEQHFIVDRKGMCLITPSVFSTYHHGWCAQQFKDKPIKSDLFPTLPDKGTTADDESEETQDQRSSAKRKRRRLGSGYDHSCGLSSDQGSALSF